MKIIALLAVAAMLMLALGGPTSSVGGPLTMMLVVFIAMPSATIEMCSAKISAAVRSSFERQKQGAVRLERNGEIPASFEPLPSAYFA